MVLLEDLERSDQISFVRHGLIPLGMNSYKGKSKTKIVCLPYQTYSGAIGVIGESGTGKSVIAKRIYAYWLGYYQSKYGFFRPGVIFDMQSEDHHLSRFPNSRPFNLFWDQGESAMGLDKIKCFAPSFIRHEAHPFDQVFGFSVDQFGYRDFLSLGMGHGAANMLSQLIRDNEGCTKDLRAFYDALMDLPKNSTEYRRTGDDYLFKLDKHKNYSSVNSLQDNFTPAFSDGVFLQEDKKQVLNNLIQLMRKGNILLINFHQEEKYYPLYAGKILKDIYMARRQSKRKEDLGERRTFSPPIIIIEEADKLVPSTQKDLHAAAFWLLEILKRGRKYDILTMVMTQEASAMNERIRDHTRQWIIGRVVANDYGFFSRFMSDSNIDVLRSLDKSKHEFCVVYPDNTFDTFYAWNSPTEINRESRLQEGSRAQ